ncbi:unnamed protein product [Caenorhabditis nigoni]
MTLTGKTSIASVDDQSLKGLNKNKVYFDSFQSFRNGSTQGLQYEAPDNVTNEFFDPSHQPRGHKMPSGSQLEQLLPEQPCGPDSQAALRPEKMTPITALEPENTDEVQH